MIARLVGLTRGRRRTPPPGDGCPSLRYDARLLDWALMRAGRA